MFTDILFLHPNDNISDFFFLNLGHTYVGLPDVPVLEYVQASQPVVNFVPVHEKAIQKKVRNSKFNNKTNFCNSEVFLLQFVLFWYIYNIPFISHFKKVVLPLRGIGIEKSGKSPQFNFSPEIFLKVQFRVGRYIISTRIWIFQMYETKVITRFQHYRRKLKTNDKARTFC